jgi:hypothetical protein
VNNRSAEVGIAWWSLAQLIQELLVRAPDGVTVDVINDRYGVAGPYTQAIRQQGDATGHWEWLVEASSAAFMSVPVPPDTYTTLRELGYSPPDDVSPNHFQVQPVDLISLEDLANLMVLTLRDGFNASLTDNYGVSPDFVAHEVLAVRTELNSALLFEEPHLRFRFN